MTERHRNEEPVRRIRHMIRSICFLLCLAGHISSANAHDDPENREENSEEVSKKDRAKNDVAEAIETNMDAEFKRYDRIYQHSNYSFAEYMYDKLKKQRKKGAFIATFFPILSISVSAGFCAGIIVSTKHLEEVEEYDEDGEPVNHNYWGISLLTVPFIGAMGLATAIVPMVIGLLRYSRAKEKMRWLRPLVNTKRVLKGQPPILTLSPFVRPDIGAGVALSIHF